MPKCGKLWTRRSWPKRRRFVPAMARLSLRRQPFRMPPRLFILRHGRSLANERRLIASSPANAVDAFGLTAEGRRQVRESIREALETGMVTLAEGCA